MSTAVTMTRRDDLCFMTLLLDGGEL